MRSRWIILVVGLIMAIPYGCVHTQRVGTWANVTPLANRQQQVNPLVGKWVNVDDQTGGITKFSIGIANNQFVVEMWGKCHPQDCYWGSVVAEVPEDATNQLHATWISTFENEFQTFTLSGDRITLQGKCRYTDSSGRKDREYTEQFVRGNFH